ncbi:MAG: MdtA/MuxA family multidrug efflux RND transporter periplasmic adaptor subunit [Pseudomonadota bacterium]
MKFIKNLHCALQRFSKREQCIILGVSGIISLFIIAKLFFGISHESNHHKDGKNQVPTVRVEYVKKSDIPLYLMALGTVTPTTSVTIRTQINGQLLRVLFKEGQLVKKGDLLAEIDSRTYDAQLLQYEGQITKDKALLENAQLDLERYKNLVKKEAISKQILDTQMSLVHQYEGTVKSDQGLIDTVKLNQTYCKITAPIAGRVGLQLIDPGNYVQTSDSQGIVVLNNINPISVVFSLPEDNLPQILHHIDRVTQLKVEAFDRGQTQLLATGTLESIDNQVDTTTGTVKFRAQFDNQKNELFPNQFVNIRLLVETLKDELTIPTAAIQQNHKGSFIYKLNNDNTVSMVSIVLKTTNGNDSAITGAIMAGERVVVDGTDKLRDGSVVTLSVAEGANTPSKKTEMSHKKHA